MKFMTEKKLKEHPRIKIARSLKIIREKLTLKGKLSYFLKFNK